MTRVDLVCSLVFVVAAGYFAWWGCFNCSPPITCRGDLDCASGEICEAPNCRPAACSTNEGAEAAAECQARSVAIGQDGETCAQDAECVAAGRGDHCVLGSVGREGTAAVCVLAAADGEDCTQAGDGFEDVTVATIGGDGAEIRFCASGLISCSSADRGRCIGGPFSATP